MKEFLLVGSGSFLGGASRYYLSGLLLQLAPNLKFPLGTFAVNLLGCLAIGIAAGLAEQHFLSPQQRILIISGFLGGFTTFSAFGLETIYLLRTQGIEFALLNVLASVALCLLAVWAGLTICEYLFT
jgi:CrcB protein